MICLPQSPSRFPYTTLFRSRTDRRGAEDARGDRQAARPYARARPPDRAGVAAQVREPPQRLQLDLADALARKAEPLADLLERLRLLVDQSEIGRASCRESAKGSEVGRSLKKKV